MVVHATMNKGDEISKIFNDKELGIKHVSFKWTTSTGIINAIGINYCNKDDIRFEFLKGIGAYDEM